MNTILRDKKSAMMFIEGSRPRRITRAKRLAFARNLPFVGTGKSHEAAVGFMKEQGVNKRHGEGSKPRRHSRVPSTSSSGLEHSTPGTSKAESEVAANEPKETNSDTL
jgi:hypothetical protein